MIKLNFMAKLIALNELMGFCFCFYFCFCFFFEEKIVKQHIVFKVVRAILCWTRIEKHNKAILSQYTSNCFPFQLISYYLFHEADMHTVCAFNACYPKTIQQNGFSIRVNVAKNVILAFCCCRTTNAKTAAWSKYKWVTSLGVVVRQVCHANIASHTQSSTWILSIRAANAFFCFRILF